MRYPIANNYGNILRGLTGGGLKGLDNWEDREQKNALQITEKNIKSAFKAC